MNDPTSVVGRRIVAYLIDLALVAVALAAVIIPQFKQIPGDQYVGAPTCSSYEAQSSGRVCVASNDQLFEASNAGVFGGGAAVVIVLFVVNQVLLEGLAGGSIGKQLLGIRVVRDDGRVCGIGKALGRNVVRIVDNFASGLVGLVCMLTSKGHRRVGDMAAHTFVVRRRAVGQPVVIPGLNAPVGSYAPYPGQQPSPYAGQPGPYGPPTTAYGQPAGAIPADQGSADGPTWDAARGAYIQYDRAMGAWLQYDDVAQAWKPIST